MLATFTAHPAAAVVVAILFLLGVASAYAVPRWCRPEEISLFMPFYAALVVAISFGSLIHYGAGVWLAGLAAYLGGLAIGAAHELLTVRRSST